MDSRGVCCYYWALALSVSTSIRIVFLLDAIEQEMTFLLFPIY